MCSIASASRAWSSFIVSQTIGLTSCSYDAFLNREDKQKPRTYDSARGGWSIGMRTEPTYSYHTAVLPPVWPSYCGIGSASPLNNTRIWACAIVISEQWVLKTPPRKRWTSPLSLLSGEHPSIAQTHSPAASLSSQGGSGRVLDVPLQISAAENVDI